MNIEKAFKDAEILSLRFIGCKLRKVSVAEWAFMQDFGILIAFVSCILSFNTFYEKISSRTLNVSS